MSKSAIFDPYMGTNVKGYEESNTKVTESNQIMLLSLGISKVTLMISILIQVTTIVTVTDYI